MSEPVYEKIQNIKNTGIRYEFVTVPGGYCPLHWHREMEILYSLNGESDVTIEGYPCKLPHKHFLVVPPEQIHSTFYHDSTAMFLCIHLDMEAMRRFMPDIAMYPIYCPPVAASDPRFEAYRGICDLLESMTRLHIEAPAAGALEAHGLILQILARLIQNFSRKITKSDPSSDRLTMERIRTVITYVEEHYREPISLADITELLGISAEYFCRFFKKNMGISFLTYVGEVRASHVYFDLIHTDQSIAEIMENNGFTNQKLFNRTFKSIYGCTPSSIRKAAEK